MKFFEHENEKYVEIRACKLLQTGEDLQNEIKFWKWKTESDLVLKEGAETYHFFQKIPVTRFTDIEPVIKQEDNKFLNKEENSNG